MQIVQHNGHWYRISAEERVTLQNDDSMANVIINYPGIQVPQVWRSANNYLPVWQNLSTGEIHVCEAGVCGERNGALKAALDAVLALPFTPPAAS